MENVVDYFTDEKKVKPIVLPNFFEKDIMKLYQNPKVKYFNFYSKKNPRDGLENIEDEQ